MTTTTNFADFGWRERKMASELLNASLEQGFPEDFSQDRVTIMMNMNSGNVFFTNDEYEVAMMNGDKLESFYNLPYSGEEGFKDDFEDRDRTDFHYEDLQFLVNIGVFENEGNEGEENQ
jgi:hypothetical protein